ncbi:PAAR domain-containing protein [Pseudomonas juntendi]|nr:MULTISPECIES: PAAR domain-containing protein [Pseudomonas]MDH2016402.1 PAAR domain-containing protein [Pseudomonas juntendi]QDR70210.1 PAAR domain-containing protein [Pseudomonas sp. BJP69]
MSLRMNIFGRYQGLDGDHTTTGAICIASQARGRVHGRNWLLLGDPTTPCPLCGQAGTIVEGESRWRQDGIPTALDGALVQCGCPQGSNRVVTGGSATPASHRAPAPEPLREAPAQAQARSPSTSTYQPAVAQPSSTPPGMEPGFYIVPRSMSYEQVLANLRDTESILPGAMLKRLNPTYQQGFKAGEIFIIGDPRNGHACTRQELHAMSAAEFAREALASLTPEEANFMMRHQADIAGLLSDASLAMGVSEAMMARSLEELGTTLRNIEKLHQQQFTKHGHLRSPEFFAERKELFNQLSAKLRAGLLNKRMELGSHDTLRRGLGISSRSLVHHWSKAGAPGNIPGYSTHLEKVASMSKYLKAGGYVGIALGGGSSLLKVQEACKSGDTAACKRLSFTEAGSFSGGLTGGGVGASIGKFAAGFACVSFGAVSGTVCSIVMVGTGSLAGSVAGMNAGEYIGEELYEFIEHE